MGVLWATIAISLASAQIASADLGKPPPGNLTEDLFYASVAAAGLNFCDGLLVGRFSQQFDTRFANRINALIKAHEARYGRNQAFDNTTSCTSPPTDYDQNKAMAAFEPKLRDLERKYGGY